MLSTRNTEPKYSYIAPYEFGVRVFPVFYTPFRGQGAKGRGQGSGFGVRGSGFGVRGSGFSRNSYPLQGAGGKGAKGQGAKVAGGKGVKGAKGAGGRGRVLAQKLLNMLQTVKIHRDEKDTINRSGIDVNQFSDDGATCFKGLQGIHLGKFAGAGKIR